MSYQLINFYRTDVVVDTSIPVTDGATTAWRFLHRLDLVNVFQPGDVLEAYGEHEVTNPTALNVQVTSAIAATNNGQWYDTDLFNTALHSIPTDGGFLAAPAGGNLVPAEHHRLITRSGIWTIPNDPSFGSYTAIIFKARACQESPSGSITIEPAGYGHLTLKHWRAC